LHADILEPHSLWEFAESKGEAAWCPHRELANARPSSALTGESQRRRSAQCPQSRNASVLVDGGLRQAEPSALTVEDLSTVKLSAYRLRDAG